MLESLRPWSAFLHPPLCQGIKESWCPVYLVSGDMGHHIVLISECGAAWPHESRKNIWVPSMLGRDTGIGNRDTKVIRVKQELG